MTLDSKDEDDGRSASTWTFTLDEWPEDQYQPIERTRLGDPGYGRRTEDIGIEIGSRLRRGHYTEILLETTKSIFFASSSPSSPVTVSSRCE